MDLSTSYLGLQLKNPLVPSSSPLTRDLGNLKRMEDAGAAAIVLYSLFEEEILHASHTVDQYLVQGTDSFAEALSYFPTASQYAHVGPEEYLRAIENAKAALEIPIIGSLNGVTTGSWVKYASQIEAAGADALELNVYFLPTSIDSTSSEVEQIYFDILADVKKSVSIPVAIKLNPYFSAMANMASRLATAGADGLIFFNRFYQPDLDLENLEVTPSLVLSESTEMRLPLRWIAILYGRIQADLALTTGIHNEIDALKGVAAGASVTMLASELLKHGIGRLTDIQKGMSDWLIEKEYDSLAQLKGSLSQINCPAPAAFERANYIRLVGLFDKQYH